MAGGEVTKATFPTAGRHNTCQGVTTPHPPPRAERRRSPQAIGVRCGRVSFLYRIAPAERCPAAAMHELAADIEVLVDDEHGSPEVSGPDGGMQPHASRPEDNHIGFIVPDDGPGAGRGLLGERLPARQNGRPYSGGCSAREEISPA